MKKVFLSLICLIAIFTLCCGFSLKAAEIGKEYTTTDEGGTYYLTLVDETTANFKAIEGGTGMVIEFSAVYKYDEENPNIISLYLVKENENGETIHDYVNDFELKDDGTFEILEVEPAPEEPSYPCQVIIKETNYGELNVDVYEGNIGDIVTITPKTYAFCKLNSISVNGVELLPNEDGVYQFALIEGENTVKGDFAINQEDMKVIAGLINDAKRGNWEDIFTIDRLFDVISWVITALFSTGFLVTLIKLKNVKAKTSDDVVTVTNDTVEKAVKKCIDELLAPLLQQFLSRSITTEEISKVLARCMVLAQENTAEARLAIISELTKLQTSDADLAVRVQTLIAEEVSKNKEIHEQKVQAIEELKKANDELNLNKKEDNSKGRI